MTDKKNGREYLNYVLEKLKERIAEISLSLVEPITSTFISLQPSGPFSSWLMP